MKTWIIIAAALAVASCKSDSGQPAENITVGPDNPSVETQPSGELSEDSKLQFLEYHNFERMGVGARPLAWDSGLADGAASYAINLAQTEQFTHSPKELRPNQGENLWMGTRGAYTPAQIVLQWADEEKYFYPGTFPDVSRTGRWEDVAHYTQIIWPSTTKVGCGMASSQTNDYVVCRYSPSGNVHGEVVGK